MENRNMVRWTNHERSLLAHFIRVGVEENNLDIKSSCEFAAKKLGRSIDGCLSQYHNYIKTGKVKALGDVEELEELEEEVVPETDKDFEMNYLKSKLNQAIVDKNTMLSNINSQLEDLRFNLVKIKELTSEITEIDVSYHINLILRTLFKN